MNLGYYWVKYKGESVMVEVVAGLPPPVLLRGFSIPPGECSEWTGPMPPYPEPGCKPCWQLPDQVRPEFHVDYDDMPG